MHKRILVASVVLATTVMFLVGMGCVGCNTKTVSNAPAVAKPAPAPIVAAANKPATRIPDAKPKAIKDKDALAYVSAQGLLNYHEADYRAAGVTGLITPWDDQFTSPMTGPDNTLTPEQAKAWLDKVHEHTGDLKVWLGMRSNGAYWFFDRTKTKNFTLFPWERDDAWAMYAANLKVISAEAAKYPNIQGIMWDAEVYEAWNDDNGNNKPGMQNPHIAWVDAADGLIEKRGEQVARAIIDGGFKGGFGNYCNVLGEKNLKGYPKFFNALYAARPTQNYTAYEDTYSATMGWNGPVSDVDTPVRKALPGTHTLAGLAFGPDYLVKAQANKLQRQDVIKGWAKCFNGSGDGVWFYANEGIFGGQDSSKYAPTIKYFLDEARKLAATGKIGGK